MGKPYSQDLRERVIAAVDTGIGAYVAAPLFRVSVSYIYKALIRRRITGEVTARRAEGQSQRRVPVEQAQFSQTLAQKKSERAAEQDRPDVAQARNEWRARQ